MVMSKAFILVLVAFFLTMALLIPLATNAQSERVSSSYVSPNIESVNYNLKVFSPNNQTSYSNLMLLDFNLQWTIDRKPTYPFSGFYSYSIDNSLPVSIESNQTAKDLYARYPEQNFKTNPSFSYVVNVSSLAIGYHNITITAAFFSGSSEICSVTAPPIQFLVQNTTPTPTTSVPEFSWLVLLPLIVGMLFVAVILRHRKTNKQSYLLFQLWNGMFHG